MFRLSTLSKNKSSLVVGYWPINTSSSPSWWLPSALISTGLFIFHRHIRYSCSYKAHVSPMHNGSSLVQCFKYDHVKWCNQSAWWNNLQLVPGTAIYIFDGWEYSTISLFCPHSLIKIWTRSHYIVPRHFIMLPVWFSLCCINFAPTPTSSTIANTLPWRYLDSTQQTWGYQVLLDSTLSFFYLFLINSTLLYHCSTSFYLMLHYSTVVPLHSP